MSSQTKYFSLLTCSEEEFLSHLNDMRKQESIQSAELKWTRSDIRKMEAIKKQRFNMS